MTSEEKIKALPKPRRPRTRPEQQADRILACAERLFLTHGFAGTSIEMLVAESGGSKRDIYRLFGDKRGLFRRVVAGLSEAGALSVQAVPHSISLETALTAIGRAFLCFLLSERALNLHRLMVTDAARLGDLGKEFLKDGPNTIYRAVEDYLRSRFSEKALSAADAAEAARIFIDSLSADLQLRALLGEVINPTVLETRVAHAVQIFSAGLQHIDVEK